MIDQMVGMGIEIVHRVASLFFIYISQLLTWPQATVSTSLNGMMGALWWNSTRSCRLRCRLSSPTMTHCPSSDASIIKCRQRSSALREEAHSVQAKKRGRGGGRRSDFVRHDWGCVRCETAIHCANSHTGKTGCSRSCSRWPSRGSNQEAWTSTASLPSCANNYQAFSNGKTKNKPLYVSICKWSAVF